MFHTYTIDPCLYVHLRSPATSGTQAPEHFGSLCDFLYRVLIPFLLDTGLDFGIYTSIHPQGLLSSALPYCLSEKKKNKDVPPTHLA